MARRRENEVMMYLRYFTLATILCVACIACGDGTEDGPTDSERVCEFLDNCIGLEDPVDSCVAILDEGQSASELDRCARCVESHTCSEFGAVGEPGDCDSACSWLGEP